MASLNPFMKTLLFRPLSAIETVLAATLLIYGVYINTPWYSSVPTTAIGAVFEADIARFFISLLYIVPPILVATGHVTHRPRFRSVGIFGMFLAYFFFSALRIATFGPISFGGWLFTLALALVAAVVFVNFKLTKID